MGRLTSRIVPNDWNSVAHAIATLDAKLNTDSSPIFLSLGLTGLTENALMYADDGGVLTSLSAATNGQLIIGSTGAAPSVAALTGTTNQIIVTPGAGSITLSTPQNIHTGATPTFAGLTVNGELTANTLTITDPDRDWTFSNTTRGTSSLALVPSGATATSRVIQFSITGDRSETVLYEIVSFGTVDDNSPLESLQMGWIAGSDLFTVRARAEGIGRIQKKLVLSADGTLDQMILETDGNISVNNKLSATLVTANSVEALALQVGDDELTDPAVITFITSEGSQTLGWDDSNQFVFNDYLSVTGNIDSTGTITGASITDGTATLTGGNLTNIGTIGASGDADLLTLSADLLTIAGGLTVDSTTLVVDADNDKVGVGTSSPNAPLEVKGTLPGEFGGFQSGLLHVTTADNSEFANSVITGHNSYNGNTQLWYLGSTSGSNNDVAFINRQNGSMTFRTSDTVRFKIDADGIIHNGDGTNETQISATGAITQTGSANAILNIDGGTLTDVTVTDIVMVDGGTIGQADGPHITFDNTNNFLEILRAKVGIGIATPNYGLHTHNPDGLSSWCQFTDNASGTGNTDGFFMGLNGSAEGSLWVAGNNSLVIVTNSTQRIKIGGDGKIGINTESPDTQLQVVGDARFGDQATNYAQISATGVVSLQGTAGFQLPHMMQSDSTTQTVGTIDVAQLVTFNTDVHHFGITRTSSSRFTILKEASYLIAISAVCDTGPGQSKDIEMWPRVNGVDVANTNTILHLNATNEMILAVTYIIHFNVDDYFEFWMTGEGTDVNILATPAVTTEGFERPACPSIIMTCNYVGVD